MSADRATRRRVVRETDPMFFASPCIAIAGLPTIFEAAEAPYRVEMSRRSDVPPADMSLPVLGNHFLYVMADAVKHVGRMRCRAIPSGATHFHHLPAHHATGGRERIDRFRSLSLF
jgi:hypothetical protein